MAEQQTKIVGGLDFIDELDTEVNKATGSLARAKALEEPDEHADRERHSLAYGCDDTHTSPSSNTSFFQIGTTALSSSMM